MSTLSPSLAALDLAVLETCPSQIAQGVREYTQRSNNYSKTQISLSCIFGGCSSDG